MRHNAGCPCKCPDLPNEELEEIESALGRLSEKLDNMENTIMATLADLLADEQAEGGEITQLVDAFNAQTATIADLQAQIAALAPGTLTADQQASIDATFAQAEQNKAAVAAVLPAPAPAPTPAPTPTV